MFDTVVLATDGSASAERAVTLALDFADRFDASVHAVYVLDASDIAGAPERVRDEVRDALRTEGEQALEAITERTEDVTTTIREGTPAAEICAYAEELEADLVVTGTRGRHGDHGYLLGSVAEAVVRQSPAPVLTARQLDADAPEDVPLPGGRKE